MCLKKLLLLSSVVVIMCLAAGRRRTNRGFFNNDFFQRYDECDCGFANEKYSPYGGYLRVIGGEKTLPHEYPWLVQIQYENKTVCGGTIISDSFVISAAHCYRKGFVQELYKVVVAQYDMCTPNNEISIFSVRKVIRHEYFDPETFFADIMLLHLSMRLKFNRFARPICLPNLGVSGVSEIYANRKGLVAGWGSTNSVSIILSCVPNKLALPIFSHKDCNATASTLFCAGYLEGGKDTCEGDSGGPFQIRNYYKRYELIGIVSSGIGCALPNSPGLYTDVTLFLPWILKHLSKFSYCW